RLLRELNRKHQAGHGSADELLESRTLSYELAAKMQSAIPDAVDLAAETQSTHRMYGLDRDGTRPFGRSCLMARRLIERGVRFVQLWSGADLSQMKSWDGHEHLENTHAAEAARIDRPVAGLLGDLKQRGLLDDTLLIFNTEFGRMPYIQSRFKNRVGGRDHN